MHTPLPPDTDITSSVCLPPARLRSRSRSGFSLIEVTLAIAIVAFAFIALIGLLPAGLSVFNQTMDSTNEMRITSDLTSTMQATDYENLTTKFSANMYYYDVDGTLLDSEETPRPEYEEQRIYMAKVVFDDQYVQPPVVKFERKTQALRALILIGKYNDAVQDRLKTIGTAADVLELLENPVANHRIRVFPMVITKTDGIK